MSFCLLAACTPSSYTLGLAGGRTRPAPLMSADTDAVFRRAQFWEPETCTLLEIANVLGRWESTSQWSERTAFALPKARREEDKALGASLQRYEMAQRMGVAERVALQQNIRTLPFTNAPLAAAFGKSVAEMDALPLSECAVDVVFDALSESKSSLIKPSVCDSRRANFFTEAGAIDEGAFAAGLYKSRALVMFAWIFFGKGRIYSVAVAIKLAVDAFELKDKLGAVGPYVDWLLLFGALAAAVAGVQNQAAIAAKTANYETVSLEEARAAAATADDDGAYSTVFEKRVANSRKPKAAQGAAGSATQLASEPWVVPLAIVLVGILSRSIGAEFFSA